MAYGTIMNRSPSSSGFLPLPGSPGSSWAIYKARFRNLFQGADASVLIAFWLFGTCSPYPPWLITNSTRCYQQCLLRYHPLCGCRSRRALGSQRRCPTSRCSALLSHETRRPILYPCNTILPTDNYNVRSVHWGHVLDCTHALSDKGWRIHRAEALWRGNSIAVKRNGRTLYAGFDTLLRTFFAGSMGQWDWGSRSNRSRSLRLPDRHLETLHQEQLAHKRIPPLYNASSILPHPSTRTTATST